MADAEVVQHPNPDLPAAPNAAPVEPAPAEQPQPADQEAAVPVVNQQELEVIIPYQIVMIYVPFCFSLLEIMNRFR